HCSSTRATICGVRRWVYMISGAGRRRTANGSRGSWFCWHAPYHDLGPCRSTRPPACRTRTEFSLQKVRSGALADSSAMGAPCRDNPCGRAKLALAAYRVMGNTMDWNERRERFRALLAGDRCIHTGSVYDAISARIAEELGFEVGIFSGSIGSMAVLGAPDLVVLTLTEVAAQANRVCRAGNLCPLVDADHGSGNALNVRRTVEELDTAGVCAMSMEDTVLPRPYGPSGKPTLIPGEEGIGKMKAALSARQDKRLVIAGRTSALAITGVDDTIRRAKAYEAAGVDAIFLAGGLTVEAIEAVSAEIKIPLITGGGAGSL